MICLLEPNLFEEILCNTIVMMIEKKFVNNELNIELISYVDARQSMWFKGKDIAQILGYSDKDQALRKHVLEDYKKKTASQAPRRNHGLV